MRGEISSARHSHRHPLDWYVDEIWCARQLFVSLAGFELEKGAGAAIWDPCCGFGNTTHAFMEEGFRVILSDVVQNVDWQAHDPARFDPEAVARGELHSPTFFSADLPAAIKQDAPMSYTPEDMKTAADLTGLSSVTVIRADDLDALKVQTSRLAEFINRTDRMLVEAFDLPLINLKPFGTP